MTRGLKIAAAELRKIADELEGSLTREAVEPIWNDFVQLVWDKISVPGEEYRTGDRPGELIKIDTDGLLIREDWNDTGDIEEQARASKDSLSKMLEAWFPMSWQGKPPVSGQELFDYIEG